MVQVGGAALEALRLQLGVVAHGGLEAVAGRGGRVRVLRVLRGHLGRRVAGRRVGGGGRVRVVVVAPGAGGLVGLLGPGAGLLAVALGQGVDELVRTHLRSSAITS